MMESTLVKGSKDINHYRGDILLIQLGDIGDVVLTMPLIRAIKDNYPNNKLMVCVREKALGLVEDSPWIDGVLSVNKQKRTFSEQIKYQWQFIRSLRKCSFDLAIDLRAGTRGAFIAFISGASCRIGRFTGDGLLWRNKLFNHLVVPKDEWAHYEAENNLRFLSCFNLHLEKTQPVLFVSSERGKKAAALLEEEKVPEGHFLIALHPFSLWGYKELRQQLCIDIIEYIQNKYAATVVMTGSDDERKRADEVVAACRSKVFNLCGRTSIGDLPGIFKNCRLFIGVDSAALHIAAAVGVPTIGIFGPSSPVSWAPWGEKHCVVSKKLDCLPCREKGCQNSGKSRCIDELSFSEIKESIDQQLTRSG